MMQKGRQVKLVDLRAHRLHDYCGAVLTKAPVVDLQVKAVRGRVA